jgi:hypothetical protein
MRLLTSWMCRAHCHRVIKLSGTLGRFAPEKELVENVHGVRGSFLETGKELRKRLESPEAAEDLVFGHKAESSVYFIGKMLWSKGLGSLMELLKYAEESAGIKIHVDMYGGGPNKDAAAVRAESLDLDMVFHGPIDHAELGFSHKVWSRVQLNIPTVCILLTLDISLRNRSSLTHPHRKCCAQRLPKHLQWGSSSSSLPIHQMISLHSSPIA